MSLGALNLIKTLMNTFYSIACGPLVEYSEVSQHDAEVLDLRNQKKYVAKYGEA